MFLGLKLIMDFVPNHTSDQHPWFISSKTGGEKGPKADWYVWKPGKVVDGKKVPPNNWVRILFLKLALLKAISHPLAPRVFYSASAKKVAPECDIGVKIATNSKNSLGHFFHS